MMTMDERVEAGARGLRAIALIDEDAARRYAEAVLFGGVPELVGAAIHNKCLKRWEAARAELVRVKTSNVAQKEIDAANKEALVAWCEYREAGVLRVRALDDGKDYLGKGDGG